MGILRVVVAPGCAPKKQRVSAYLCSIHVTANPSDDEATGINYPTVRLSGSVEIFLIWTVLKTVAKRILSVLPRLLIHEKEQVLPPVDLSEKKKKEPEMDKKFLKEFTLLREGIS
jgi:hypothetical protein